MSKESVLYKLEIDNIEVSITKMTETKLCYQTHLPCNEQYKVCFCYYNKVTDKFWESTSMFSEHTDADKIASIFTSVLKGMGEFVEDQLN